MYFYILFCIDIQRKISKLVGGSHLVIETSTTKYALFSPLIHRACFSEIQNSAICVHLEVGRQVLCSGSSPEQSGTYHSHLHGLVFVRIVLWPVLLSAQLEECTCIQVSTVCAVRNETLVFVNFSAQDASILNIKNLCGHHQEEVLRIPKHPKLAKFG